MMVLHSHLQAKKFPNCRKIGQELEVSSKTIQRDIEFMRYRLGLPIEYDPLHFGYYYSEAVEAFPAIEVSEGEVTALFVAQKALAQYKGTPYEQPLRTAFRKLTDSLTDRISFSWSQLDDVISFRAAGASVADLKLFEAVSDAVLHSREIAFEYRKLRSSGYEERQAQPYHLASVENQWYLFAFDTARKQVRTFALPRMRNVRPTGGKFTRPQNFSAAQMLSQSFGVFSTSGKHRVRIWFDDFSARLIAERVWHESQQITRRRDGSIVLELELGSLQEIERWILSWGTHARALAPGALVQRIKNAARQLVKRYA